VKGQEFNSPPHNLGLWRIDFPFPQFSLGFFKVLFRKEKNENINIFASE
jgi:hypothetical protein